MSIIAIISGYIAVVMIGKGGGAREKNARADIAKLEMALDAYHLKFREYPPDTGYGLRKNGQRPEYKKTVKGVEVNVVTYDPGSLWRYLRKALTDPMTGKKVGPFLKDWNPKQLKRYDDFYSDQIVDVSLRQSYCLIDPWGNPYGFIGTRKRVVHNPASFDLFSAGRDGVTACNNKKDDPALGQTSGDGRADCSEEPDSLRPYDNRAYNTNSSTGKERNDNPEEDDVANDSSEFGPEAIRNGDIGDDISNWSAG